MYLIALLLCLVTFLLPSNAFHPQSFGDILCSLSVYQNEYTDFCRGNKVEAVHVNPDPAPASLVGSYTLPIFDEEDDLDYFDDAPQYHFSTPLVQRLSGTNSPPSEQFIYGATSIPSSSSSYTGEAHLAKAPSPTPDITAILAAAGAHAVTFWGLLGFYKLFKLINRKRSELVAYRRQYIRLQQVADHAGEVNVRLRENRDRLQIELDLIRDDALEKATNVSNLHVQIKNLEKEIIKLKPLAAGVSKLKSSVFDLTEERNSLRAKLVSREAEAFSAEKQYQNLTVALTESKRNLQNTRSELQSQREREKTLTTELSEKKEDVAQLHEANASLHCLLNASYEAYDIATQTIRRVNSDLIDNRIILEPTKEHVSRLEGRLSKLQQFYSELQGHNKAVEGASADIKASLVNLESESRSLSYKSQNQAREIQNLVKANRETLEQLAESELRFKEMARTHQMETLELRRKYDAVLTSQLESRNKMLDPKGQLKSSRDVVCRPIPSTMPTSIARQESDNDDSSGMILDTSPCSEITLGSLEELLGGREKCRHLVREILDSRSPRWSPSSKTSSADVDLSECLSEAVPLQRSYTVTSTTDTKQLFSDAQEVLGIQQISESSECLTTRENSHKSTIVDAPVPRTYASNGPILLDRSCENGPGAALPDSKANHNSKSPQRKHRYGLGFHESTTQSGGLDPIIDSKTTQFPRTLIKPGSSRCVDNDTGDDRFDFSTSPVVYASKPIAPEEDVFGGYLISDGPPMVKKLPESPTMSHSKCKDRVQTPHPKAHRTSLPQFPSFNDQERDSAETTRVISPLEKYTRKSNAYSATSNSTIAYATKEVAPEDVIWGGPPLPKDSSASYQA